jgi:hypothetical protein
MLGAMLARWVTGLTGQYSYTDPGNEVQCSAGQYIYTDPGAGSPAVPVQYRAVPTTAEGTKGTLNKIDHSLDIYFSLCTNYLAKNTK